MWIHQGLGPLDLPESAGEPPLPEKGESALAVLGEASGGGRARAGSSRMGTGAPELGGAAKAARDLFLP